MPNGLYHYLLLICAMLIWGSIGIFVRLASQPAEFIVFFRVAIAFCIMFCVLLLNNKPLLVKSHLKYLILSGIAVALNWLFLFKAVQTTTISNAVLPYYLAPVLSYLGPVSSILFAYLIFGEIPMQNTLFGGILIVIASLLVVFPYQSAKFSGFKD